MTRRTDDLNKQPAQGKSLQSEIKALNETAWELRSVQSDRARSLAQQALELSQLDAALREERAASLVVLGFVNKDEGKLEIAFSQIHEAFALLKNLPPPMIACDARFVIAWAYIHLGDYPLALEYATQARKLARDLGSRDNEALALNTEAYVYYLSEDPAEALRIVKETGDLHSQCFILNNMALALMAAGKHEDALVRGEESLLLAREQLLFNQELNVADTIAQILLDMGNYTEAERYLKQSLSENEKHDPDILQVYLLSNLGRAFLGQRDFEQAEALFQRGLAAASEVDARAEQAICHKLLCEIYESQDRLREAFDHFKLFHALNETVAGEKAVMRLSALKVTHQVETTQRDAEIYRLQTLELQREIEERKRTQVILEKLATLDSLTDLYNRRHFYSLAQREIERVVRYKRSVTALMLDIDHFKQVNDIHGHAVGDEALRAIANILRKSLREVDILGRFGGEEFAILLPETHPDKGRQVAERIRLAIAEQPITTAAGDLSLTISIGVTGIAGVKPNEAFTLDQLLKQADDALYQAKHNGRNRTVVR